MITHDLLKVILIYISGSLRCYMNKTFTKQIIANLFIFKELWRWVNWAEVAWPCTSSLTGDRKRSVLHFYRHHQYTWCTTRVSTCYAVKGQFKFAESLLLVISPVNEMLKTCLTGMAHSDNPIDLITGHSWKFLLITLVFLHYWFLTLNYSETVTGNFVTNLFWFNFFPLLFLMHTAYWWQHLCYIVRWLHLRNDLCVISCI